MGEALLTGKKRTDHVIKTKKQKKIQVYDRYMILCMLHR